MNTRAGPISPLTPAVGYREGTRNMTWQPIETAPKDFTRIWACRAGAPRVSGEIYWSTGKRPKWRDAGGNPLLWEPTHWMPIPEPPQ